MRSYLLKYESMTCDIVISDLLTSDMLKCDKLKYDLLPMGKGKNDLNCTAYTLHVDIMINGEMRC